MKLTKTTRTLLLAANIWYFGEGMIGPLYAIFAEKVGGDILDITWAWSAYLVCTGCCYILFGRLFNRKKYKAQMMVFGYTLNAVLTFGYLLVDNPFKLFLVQVGLGVAEAIGTPLWDSLYASSLTEEHDTYAWGLSTGQSQIVSGFAFGVGGLMTYYYSFNVLFIAMGVIQLIAAVVSMQLLKKTNS
jgi:predicted MFS family arabinose efflux permease